MESIFQQHTKRIFVFTGAFGSGKTEVAVNFTEVWALALREARRMRLRPAPSPLEDVPAAPPPPSLATPEAGSSARTDERAARREEEEGRDPSDRVSIADLDIVNLYFRSRDVRQELAAQGITVLAPDDEHVNADLPIIIPQVRGAVRNPRQRLVLDVGGNDLGARVLASMRDVMPVEAVEFLLVVNGNRPFTEDAAGAEVVLRQIEAASGLAVTGLVSNTHLMDETTIDVIVDGYRLAVSLGRSVGVPVRFAAVEGDLADRAREVLDLPVLRLRRRMLPTFRRPCPRRGVPGQPLGKPGKEMSTCLE